MRITIDGELNPGVSAKDLVLHLIGTIGVNGGTGHVIEYAGEAIRALDMEGRMTVCNMSIEAGAKAGVIAPDATTVEYLRGRSRVPTGEAFEQAARRWMALASDEGAVFDREIRVNAAEIAPTVTYGTDPGMVVPVDGVVPQAANETAQRALDYMAVESGKTMLGRQVDLVFIGSCTNGRLSDMRAAAKVLEGRKVAAGVRMLVVPGSEQVRLQAEAEGLHEVFENAGAEWRIPGCSMCLAMNGDIVPPRQGAGSRSILASPATAAASAIAGRLSDPRDLLVQREVA
jgi:3-isopropylmalate/(R)-2-methylmalate dehydratase large subunit